MKILMLWGFNQKFDFRGKGLQKKQYLGRNCLKKGWLGDITDLTGGELGKKEEGGAFEMGLILRNRVEPKDA